MPFPCCGTVFPFLTDSLSCFWLACPLTSELRHSFFLFWHPLSEWFSITNADRKCIKEFRRKSHIQLIMSFPLEVAPTELPKLKYFPDDSQINYWMFAMIGIGCAFITFVGFSIFIMCRGSRRDVQRSAKGWWGWYFVNHAGTSPSRTTTSGFETNWHNIEDKFISYTQVEKIEPDQNLDVVPLWTHRQIYKLQTDSLQ